MTLSDTLDLTNLDLSGFPPAEQEVLREYIRRKALRAKGDSFLDFVSHVAPWVVIEEVHCLLAHHFEMLKDGDIDRLMIQMPPRTGKSLFTSELLPAWWEGHYPSDKILHTSYASTLVEKFGRKIRNMVASPDYQQIFPGTVLTKDSRAAAQWATTAGGEYNAVGVGGGVAGKGGHLLLCDDPMSEQDMFSRSVMDSIYDWYGSGFYTRRQPERNAFLITMCMTGDTPVLMADGVEKPLRDIRPGDRVATYDNEKLATTRVMAHKSSGRDTIFTLRTRSGRILRANERHPFLVEHEGERKWMRLRELRVGANLVALKAVSGTLDQTLNQGCAHRAYRETRTAKNTLTLISNLWATTVSGKERPASTKAAQNLSGVKDCARGTTKKLSGHLASALRHITQQPSVVYVSSIATELIKKALTHFYPPRMVYALSAASHHLQKIPARTGTTNYALITATTRMSFEGSSATTATLRLDTLKHQKSQMLSLDTSDFTVDELIFVEETGYDEVFDIEIERTENFIANGVVSHNTRWNQADLAGRLLADSVTNPNADQWTQLVIPAILDDESARLLNQYSKDSHITHPHHYKAGDSFSPRRWPLSELIRTKNTISRKAWASLYMQSPVEDGGGIFMRDDWRAWKAEKLPRFEYIMQFYDTAFEEGEANDYSARITWGVFKRESDGRLCVMMLERLKERLTFSKLLDNALDSYKEYKPDRVGIEKAASGAPLIQEMRRRGVPVTPLKPAGSKIARANASAVVLEQGVVYYPYGKRWADDVIEDCASFPNADHDDIPDVVAHSLIFFRKMFLLEMPDDEEDEADDDLDAPIKRSYATRRSRLPASATN